MRYLNTYYSTVGNRGGLYSNMVYQFFHYRSMKTMYTIKGKLCKQRIKDKNKKSKANYRSVYLKKVRRVI